MENKNSLDKKAFALLLTIFLVVIISLFSLRIIENNIFLSNLNSLKYLHLQANIHLDYLKNYLLTHNQSQIDSLVLADKRFKLDIIKKNEDNKTAYYIYLKTADDTPIRLSHKIIK